MLERDSASLLNHASFEFEPESVDSCPTEFLTLSLYGFEPELEGL